MPDIVGKIEVTEEYIRIPVSPRREGDRIRTIVISEKDGIKALYAGNRKVILTYLFDKDKWTVAEAKAWVKAHVKSAEEGNVERFKTAKEVSIKKFDMEKGIVYGEVYVPDEVDTDGDFMSKEEIEKLAHRFLIECRKMDVQHDKKEGAAVPVESFIARKGDPDFIEGAWVLASKILDPEVLEKVKNGKITAYSWEGYAMGRRIEQ